MKKTLINILFVLNFISFTFQVKFENTICKVSVSQHIESALLEQTQENPDFEVTVSCYEDSKTVQCKGSEYSEFILYRYKVNDLNETIYEEQAINTDKGLIEEHENEKKQILKLQQKSEENKPQVVKEISTIDNRRRLFHYDDQTMMKLTYTLNEGSHTVILENYKYHDIRDAEGCGLLIYGIMIQKVMLLVIGIFMINL